MPGRSLTSLITDAVARVSVSRSGPAMKYCTLALDWPVLKGGTESTVMRHSVGKRGTISLRTRSMRVCWSSRKAGSFRRTKMPARFGVRWSLSPMVRSVPSTPGSSRIARAKRSAMRSVAARLVPSGVRMFTTNSASSTGGRKLFCTIFISVGTAARMPKQPSTMIQRCRMEKRSSTM